MHYLSYGESSNLARALVRASGGTTKAADLLGVHCSLVSKWVNLHRRLSGRRAAQISARLSELAAKQGKGG